MILSMYTIWDFGKKYWPILISVFYLVVILFVVEVFQNMIAKTQELNPEQALVNTIALSALMLSIVSLALNMMFMSSKKLLNSDACEKQIKYLNERLQKIYVPLNEFLNNFEKNKEFDNNKLDEIISNRFILNEIEKINLEKVMGSDLSQGSKIEILKSFDGRIEETQNELRKSHKDLQLSLDLVSF
ncbi:hypothetical protein MmiAt1_05200 [Methanimicrococcus sp. At1]|uniref:Uncharacterized protein n=2 Tax=Methanimicrococcus hacksteinii TaxID=3028293 RepID=A0ABU3VNT9_9EURY|nr:hypothetical protein [Methanimicrococcus sp. At1]